MPSVNLKSQIGHVKQQFEQMALSGSKKHVRSLHYHIVKHEPKLEYSLSNLSTEIHKLDPKSPRIEKILMLWGSLNEILDSERGGESSMKHISLQCSKTLDEIFVELNTENPRYQAIPLGSPFSHNRHFPMHLCLIRDDIKTHKFSSQFYLLNDDGSFRLSSDRLES